jgi:putative Mg2+ transporter-C (MgtC) family protein
MLHVLWQELTHGLGNSEQVVRALIRLVAATLLGGLVGIQRESTHKPAGLRTHVLVCLGTAAFVVGGSFGGLSVEGISRVIQGVITGIGFIGAGSILKISQEHAIKGLTTAASVWIAAAIGVVVGLGSLGIALMITALAFIVLSLARVEHSVEDQLQNHHADHDHAHED